MNIRNKQELIIDLLTKHPHLRDDDNRLIATVWNIEQDTDNMSAFDLLKLVAQGEMTNTESIRRSRAKIQQERIELHGDKYIERHRHQPDVVEQLHEMEYELN